MLATLSNARGQRRQNDPLPHLHPRQHLVDQMGRALGHPAAVTSYRRSWPYGGCARMSLNSLIVTLGSVDCIGAWTSRRRPCLATLSMLGSSMMASNMPALLLANTVRARRIRLSSKSLSVLSNAHVSDLSASVSWLSGTGVGTRRSGR